LILLLIVTRALPCRVCTFCTRIYTLRRTAVRLRDRYAPRTLPRVYVLRCVIVAIVCYRVALPVIVLPAAIVSSVATRLLRVSLSFRTLRSFCSRVDAIRCDCTAACCLPAFPTRRARSSRLFRVRCVARSIERALRYLVAFAFVLLPCGSILRCAHFTRYRTHRYAHAFSVERHVSRYRHLFTGRSFRSTVFYALLRLRRCTFLILRVRLPPTALRCVVPPRLVCCLLDLLPATAACGARADRTHLSCSFACWNMPLSCCVYRYHRLPHVISHLRAWYAEYRCIHAGSFTRAMRALIGACYYRLCVIGGIVWYRYHALHTRALFCCLIVSRYIRYILEFYIRTLRITAVRYCCVTVPRVAVHFVGDRFALLPTAFDRCVTFVCAFSTRFVAALRSFRGDLMFAVISVVAGYARCARCTFALRADRRSRCTPLRTCCYAALLRFTFALRCALRCVSPIVCQRYAVCTSAMRALRYARVATFYAVVTHTVAAVTVIDLRWVDSF